MIISDFGSALELKRILSLVPSYQLKVSLFLKNLISGIVLRIQIPMFYLLQGKKKKKKKKLTIQE